MHVHPPLTTLHLRYLIHQCELFHINNNPALHRSTITFLWRCNVNCQIWVQIAIEKRKCDLQQVIASIAQWCYHRHPNLTITPKQSSSQFLTVPCSSPHANFGSSIDYIMCVNIRVEWVSMEMSRINICLHHLDFLSLTPSVYRDGNFIWPVPTRPTA